ncbi:hypothetical protein [Kitasatospora humi]|nr:hypothetical protein [Kitasatospora humi]
MAAADPVYREAFAEHGGWARWGRMQTWLADQRDVNQRALPAGTRPG